MTMLANKLYIICFIGLIKSHKTKDPPHSPLVDVFNAQILSGTILQIHITHLLRVTLNVYNLTLLYVKRFDFNHQMKILYVYIS